jgi:hypothetical protein
MSTTTEYTAYCPTCDWESENSHNAQRPAQAEANDHKDANPDHKPSVKATTTIVTRIALKRRK